MTKQEQAQDYIRRWGGLLICKSCQHLSPVDRMKANSYMSHGWPTCCGETMVYVKKEDDPNVTAL